MQSSTMEPGYYYVRYDEKNTKEQLIAILKVLMGMCLYEVWTYM